MKAFYSERAGKALDDLPVAVRKAFLKQVAFLEQNLRHPSLRAKKYDEAQNLWQARATKGWRFISSSWTMPSRDHMPCSGLAGHADPPTTQLPKFRGSNPPASSSAGAAALEPVRK